MPKPAKEGYLPSLDGWRAVSILGVVLSHDDPTTALHGPQSVGSLGVYIFFAISGVLMAWRIQKDEAKTGRFDIRNFYLRRLFRIQPAALTYLLVIGILMCAGAIPDWWRFWLGALLAYRNFQFHPLLHPDQLPASWFTGQFWSLAVEEHFYVLLSLFFLCVKRRRIAALTGVIALLLALQHVALTHRFFPPDQVPRSTFFVLQYLLFPALLSLGIQTARGMRWAKLYCRPWVVFTLSAIMLAAAAAHRGILHGHDVWYIVKAEQVNLCWLFGFWVIATTVHARSLTTRVLELKPLRYIGRLSYSLYLWQQLFLWKETPVQITWKPLLWAGQRPMHYLFLVAATLFSYYCVEKPMIRLGHRLAPPATPGHADLAASPAPVAAT